jgi:hypothetical protein
MMEQDELKEALLEIERLQELHRKNVLDVRRYRLGGVDRLTTPEETSSLINKLENRSRMALPRQGKNL